jgi:membrane-associated phospholipid phosphatase
VVAGRPLSATVARFSALGEHGFLWFVIAAVCRRWDAARTIAIAYGANQLVKVIVRRKRPPQEGRLTGTLSDLSYPSAHAATSVAGARRLSETLPPAPLWVLAAALAGSRLYLRVHHPSDTVAGAALGGAVAELTR